MNDPELVAFLQWALPRLGLRWQGYRKVRARVRKKLNERLRQLGLPDIAAYRDRLEAHPQESERGAEAVRCWSAGCASGEEPYTLRILWERELPAERGPVPLQIVATDVDEQLLERARQGLYPASSLKELPRELLETAFVREGEQFRLRDELRVGVEFYRQDIREVMPAGPFDLVLCRNLAFIYFEEEGRREVLRGIDERLVAGGYLVLGAHESLHGGVPDLVSCRTRPELWQKRADA
jgi:chemotaxis protein methyltransferase CheR